MASVYAFCIKVRYIPVIEMCVGENLCNSKWTCVPSAFEMGTQDYGTSECMVLPFFKLLFVMPAYRSEGEDQII